MMNERYLARCLGGALLILGACADDEGAAGTASGTGGTDGTGTDTGDSTTSPLTTDDPTLDTATGGTTTGQGTTSASGTESTAPTSGSTSDGSTSDGTTGGTGDTDTTTGTDGTGGSTGNTVVCTPGESQCNGDVVETCNDLGDGWEIDHECDPVQNVTCDEDLAQCVGACAPEQLGTTYIGCDYYPTVTAGLWETVPWNFNFAVVVSNTTNQAADITVTQGAAAVANVQVAANTAQVIELPWVDDLVMSSIDEAGPSRIVEDGAYRLRSTQPVTVYQYNPIEYTLNGTFSNTNDASLLFPVNAWGEEYMVVSRNHWVPPQATAFDLPGFYAVVAQQDGTTVQLSPSASGGIVVGGDGVGNDGTGMITLDQGDVLEVFTAEGGGNPDASDLTGTILTADRPVQVFGGHKCTNIPWDVVACDRLEESMLPLNTIADTYLVTAPQRSDGGINAQYVRITATEDGTTLTYDPAIAGAPAMIMNAGDYVEVENTTESFQVSASAPVLVSQYMRGQGDGPPGDPSMAMTVPTQQYRNNYLIHAPTNYTNNFVNITAAMGTTVMLDGAQVGALTPIGATGYGFVRVELSNAGDGNHTLTGDDVFGVTVYGYGDYTSYWYPGGLDLQIIQ